MSLRHAVLGLLAELPRASGYDLLKMFEISLDNVWPATQSQLYGELGKLAKEGMIEVAAEGARGRKEYELTDAGRAELLHWLLEVPPKPARRDDTLLRVFFLGQVGPEAARDFLTKQGKELDRRLADLLDLEGRIKWDDDNLAVYGRLAMEYGKRFMAMRRDWYEWAAKEIEGHERDGS
ncbi:PadR family transcriptional regulator [Actinomadura hibisca]|uniref:PadR family transcriptional regulator n=1 Tax=Actinomadura hibisca TaxID=68565 RepID=UPI0008360016|nr:PadR family transcriptional regulator [Actinomadura hibisca]